MQFIHDDNRHNLHPLTKFFAVICLSFTPFYRVSALYCWVVVATIAILFALQFNYRDAIKAVIYFGFLSLLPSDMNFRHIGLIHVLFSLILIIKAFYLPCLSAKLLIKTTDVGSLLSALSQINIPRTIRIPIAVIFRFFPSFKQEYKNMHLAMKVKNITWRTPIKYITYMWIPLLILSSNIADDIAKVAETKCIYNPIKRTHYFSIKFGLMDILYLLSLLLLVTKGCKLC